MAVSFLRVVKQDTDHGSKAKEDGEGDSHGLYTYTQLLASTIVRLWAL